MTNKSIVLCILDGWGHSENQNHNAITKAKLPFFNWAQNNMPCSMLDASGIAVGIPANTMGNSEVGHMTIGSGRIIKQDIVRINEAILSEDFKNSTTLRKYTDYLLKHNKTCHFIGLVSDGGVHSHINHLIAYATFFQSLGIKQKIHAITDGRDTSPQSAKIYLSALATHNLNIATISGRFYALDRDKRFERTALYYQAIAHSIGKKNTDIDAILSQYESDEFIEPHIVQRDYHGIGENDVLFFFNFRADRMRQITQALLDPHFNAFPRSIAYTHALSLTSYIKTEKQSLVDVLFPTSDIKETLGEVLSSNHLKQLRIAETEKYPHVTYFLNGGREEPYPLEDRVIVPSPKVQTYDMAPEMSAYQLTQSVINAITQNKYALICVNFANADMVGHTANMQATITACETIDTCLKRIFDAAQSVHATLLVTSDHGNAEELFDISTQQNHTAHTLNPVPFICIGEKQLALRTNGGLSDIAPTVLDLLNLKKPTSMSGFSLIKQKL